jgi:hypothetical protein
VEARGNPNGGDLPVVLLLSLEKESWFEEMLSDLLSTLHKHARVIEAQSESVAVSHLEGGGVTAVVVTDAALVNGGFKGASKKLVKYAKGGGTVGFGGVVSCFARPLDMHSYFSDEWGIPWETGSYHRAVFSTNESALSVEGRECFSALPTSYSMKALQIQGVDQKDMVYVEDDCPTESPIVFAKYGKGNVGWIGDVNAENETTLVVKVLCGT